jgi:hypothetical protein
MQWGAYIPIEIFFAYMDETVQVEEEIAWVQRLRKRSPSYVSEICLLRRWNRPLRPQPSLHWKWMLAKNTLTFNKKWTPWSAERWTLSLLTRKDSSVGQTITELSSISNQNISGLGKCFVAKVINRHKLTHLFDSGITGVFTRWLRATLLFGRDSVLDIVV